LQAAPHEAEDALADPTSDGGRRRASCDDLEATFDRLATATGVEMGQEPIRQPGGARDIVVLDPAGIVLLIVHG
jgi:hypothetical protein